MIIEKIIILLLIQNTDLIVAELFTSNAHLENAIYAERAIANMFKDYVEREEARLEIIRRLADDYRKHSATALEDTELFLGNPINAFLLIKKFTFDWDRDVVPVISNNSWDIMRDQIDKVKSYLPVYEDLTGAASALMRLQDTYHLHASTIAKGDIGGIKSPILSAAECFELGRLSYSEKDYYHTTLWMEQALIEHERDGTLKMKTERKHTDEEDINKEELSKLEVDPVEVLDYLAFSIFELGNIHRALDLTNELLKLDPSHVRALNNKRNFEMLMQNESVMQQLSEEQKTPGYELNRDNYRRSDEFLRYEALCRGEDVMPVKNKSRLTCQYVSNNHPLLLLQPAKEETMYLDPFIVVYHDVISDEEIRLIKQLATPRLYRATVHNPITGQLEPAHYRISKSAWLNGEEHPVVQRVNDRISAITGLDMKTAEELQVANYGLGGHYEPHFDFATRKKKNELEEKFGNRLATFLNYEAEKEVFMNFGTGNRIATFLNYMSDVEAGGATVFPRIGLKLFPKKGSAAFWYNLYRNGEGIQNTRHAACPVLVGTKWIANKWMHEVGQEFRRPCGLTADE